MSYKKGADGITKQGKTDAKVYPNEGPKVMGRDGGKKSAGVKNANLKSMGRNMARVANQRGR
jgi:hypothetical protein